eukprot:858150_1
MKNNIHVAVVDRILTKDDREWVSDASTNQCYDCKESIKSGLIYSGKHHCRLCGCILCNTCSRRYFVLYRSTKQCVCMQCHHGVHSDDILTIDNMDTRLAEYYETRGCEYYNACGIGKLTEWCAREDNEINQESMNEELRASESFLEIANLDDEFPLIQHIENDTERKKEVFLVLNHGTNYAIQIHTLNMTSIHK